MKVSNTAVHNAIIKYQNEVIFISLPDLLPKMTRYFCPVEIFNLFFIFIFTDAIKLKTAW